MSAKITEIGTDEIKYKQYNHIDGPTYVLETSRIDSIVYEDGRVETFTGLSFKDEENYIGQRSKAIKLNFLSPLAGYLQITYEKSVSPLQGFELSLGIIGAGKNQSFDYYYNGEGNREIKRDAFGAFVQVGYKFNKLPDYLRKGTRITHIMQGTYFRPELTLGYYKDNVVNHTSGNVSVMKRKNFFGAIMLNIGHQWIFGEKWLVDLYGGVGYAFDNTNEDKDDIFSDYYSNHFVIQKAGQGASVGLSGGLRVGLLLK